MRIDFERFCAQHPYRVVGPNIGPERRFSTLYCAARTVLSEGPEFHVECGDFRASFAECRGLAIDADSGLQIEAARQQSHWDRVETCRQILERRKEK